MALAPVITLIYKEVGPPPIVTTQYSWISKAKCTGMNKHMGWILAVLWIWRRFTC
jgi:hypothetical protein